MAMEESKDTKMTHILKLNDSELQILITYYEMGMNLKDEVAQNLAKQMHKDDNLDFNKDVVWLKLQDLIGPTGEFAECGGVK